MKASSKRGRPSKFKPEYVEQAGKLAALAATDVQIADFFKVTVSTLFLWKKQHPDFSEALKINKAKADEIIENSLYHRARGYSHEAVKILMHKGKPVVVPYMEHHPPDTTACIFWLKNRNPKEWRDRIEHTGEGGGPLTVTVMKFGAKHSPSE